MKRLLLFFCVLPLTIFSQSVQIGDTFEGGVIFYLDGNGGGLVSAPSNSGAYPGLYWGCDGTNLVGANETAIGTGNQNTNDILNGCTTAGIAADICANLTIGGYNDWFLPSKDELNQLYINKVSVGGFMGGDYWSSTQAGSFSAFYQNFNVGSQWSGTKDAQRSVRAIRAFSSLPGCTDSTAFNYDSNANIDDGSCEAIVLGCLDVAAFNYNVLANTDDSSCIAVILGCTDPLAFNYNASSNTDDGSCLYCSYMDNDNIADLYSTNVSCNSGDDGSIYGIDLTSAILNNGNGPYTYSIDSGITFQSSTIFNYLSAGNYYVTYMDANGCINPNAGQFWMEIIEPDSLVYNSDLLSDISCNGNNYGSAFISVQSGNTAPWTITWSNSEVGDTAFSLNSGNNYAIISDANNCIDTVEFNLYSPLVVSNQVTQVSCNGGDGAIDITISGGEESYTYSWKEEAWFLGWYLGFQQFSTNQDVSNLDVGLYLLEITDANGCIYTDTFDLGNYEILVSSQTTNNLCYAGSNGAIDITASAGLAPYTFLWSNGSTSEDISNLSFGDYSVIVTDANGCINFDTISILEPNEIVVSGVVNNVTSACNGSVTTNVNGGTPPYNYNWNTISVLDSFTVNLATPTPVHPYYGNGQILVYELQGVQGLELTLLRGHTYNFNMDNVVSYFPFYITSDSYGGNNFIGEVTNGVINSRAINYETLTFTPDSTHADTLYYHAGTQTHMGYRIILVDGYTTEDLNNICVGSYNLTVTDSSGCIASSVFNIGNITYGCTDSLACNYNSNANSDDGSCLTIFGCMDSIACNYDVLATCDNGTCANIYGCTDSTAFNYSALATCDDGFCFPVVNGCMDSTQFNYNILANTDDGSCISITLGCIDSLALNYNVSANTDDGSCIAVVYGCTDSTQFNYYAGANVNDGSCISYNYGCMDSTMFNYNASANTDDGSCFAYSYGCIDSTMFNYNIAANIDDGSCIAFSYGCTDPLMFNYNTSANTDDGSCISFVYGCMDSTMFNYNSLANTNDSSCISFSYGCTDSTMFNYNVSSNTDDGTCIVTVYGCTNSTMFNYDAFSNADDGSCILFIYGCTDPTSFNYDALVNTDDGTCIPFVYGCTNSTMFNYDAIANTDDGSCILFIYGCMSSTMFNYNPLANTDDGSCILFIYGCTDSTMFNFNHLANTANGTCLPFVYGCTDPTSFNYDALVNTDDGSCIPFMYGCMDSTFANYNPIANIDNGNCANFTYVPDDNFEQHLINIGLDSGPLNDTVLTAAIDTVQNLNLNSKNIYDITGIEDFQSLRILSCENNQLSNLDLSSNLFLENLYCHYNQLTSLDLSNNLNLNWLRCSNNNIDSLTFGSQLITYIHCANNQLQYINTSNLTDLHYLNLSYNQFTNIDLSANTDLTYAYLNNNNLSSLNFQNGNNTALTLYNSLNNPNLSCVQVDDATYSTSNWTTLDFWTAFSTNCSLAGCSDPLACNYNPLVFIDDGSCLAVYGCTDSTAFNYDLNATCADASCILSVYGCMDSIMFNFDLLANTDDGSCITYNIGCTDSTMYNYNSSANTSDSSCMAFVYGCTDSTQFNYNDSANTDDGSCLAYIYGCTDSTQFNYIVLANTDDGSCIPYIYGCTDSSMYNYTTSANTDDGTCCYSTTSTTIDTACDSYTWNGETYDSSGTYTYNVSETNNSYSLEGGNVEVYEPNGHFGGMQKLTISFDFVLNSTPAGASSGSYGSYSTLVEGGAISSGYGGAFLIQLKGETEVLRFFVNNGSWNNLSQVSYSYTNFNLYQEYNLCAVYDENGLYLYVDGVLVSTSGSGNVIGALGSTNYVRFGSFDGILDNVSIWDKAFDSTQVQEHVNSCIDIADTNLLGYWDFEEGSGITAYDQSSYNSHGTILGSASYNTHQPLKSCGIQNISGCDSTAILNLTINPSTTSTSSATACDDYSWNGTTYTSSGTYIWIGTNSNGCDSTAIINLTIDNSTISSTSITECNSYSWNSSTYTTSGSYTYSTSNSKGCDSIATLNLTIDICGCTDSTALNYNPNAISDDGSCIAILYGCTDSLAANYDPYSLIDDGSCITAIHGCTDSLAINFDPLATVDDNTCYYCSITTNSIPLFSSSLSACNGFVSVTPTSGSAPYTYSWSDGNTTNFNNNLCDGAYTYTVIDANGCGFTEIIILTTYLGCMDSTAMNYDYIAIIDDGTCLPFIYGCMDSTATNYNATANTDDGTCIPYLYGCTDSAATNYDVLVNTDDESCVYCYAVADIGSDTITACDSVLISTNTITNGSYVWNISSILTSAIPSIGDTHQGGIVFYLDGNGGGLISTLSDQSTIAEWGCYGTDILGADGIAIGTGNQNTIDIINANCTPNWGGNTIAADVCANLTLNGFSDWFLPSKDELNEMYSNIGQGSVLGNVGGFANNLYWSSTEDGAVFSFFQDFSDGYQNNHITYHPKRVRAIRNSSIPISITNSVMVSSSGWNYVSVTDSLGCTATDSVYVQIDICGCTDSTALNYNPSATSDDGSCIATVYGCMDSSAINFAPNTNADDGSCLYCDLSITQLAITPPSGTCDGWAYVQATSSYSPITYTWSNGFAGTFNMSLCTGVYSVTITDAYGCFIDTTINVGSVILGCTDPNATNYDVTATVDDGSCTYTVCTDYPTNLNVFDVIDNRVNFAWDNMNTANCMVLKYYVRYREVGASAWNTRAAGVGNGLCNFGLNTTSQLLLGLTASTTYEWKLKAFYCGGSSSNYSPVSTFTTEDACPSLANLAVQTYSGNHTKANFTWDSTGTYTYARVTLRVDTIGSAWQTVGGFGTFYPALSQIKFGLTAGESYRAGARAYCNANISSHRSWWTPFIFWTQPGIAIKLEGGAAINNLDIYPNPSRDIFNISFTSADKQDIKVRIMNVVGEVIISEDLQQFIGEYTKQINLSDNAKGIYFLEIETNDGVINKKLILQ